METKYPLPNPRQCFIIRAAMCVLNGSLDIVTFTKYVSEYGSYAFTSYDPTILSGVYDGMFRKKGTAYGGGFLSCTNTRNGYGPECIIKVLCPYSINTANKYDSVIQSWSLYLDNLNRGDDGN